MKHNFKGKKIVIMGLGLNDGGVGSAKFFASLRADVLITDLKTKGQLKESVKKLKGLGISFVLGEHRKKDFREADLVIKNPAVPSDSPYLKLAKAYFTLKRYREAIEKANKAIVLAPDKIDPYLLLGFCYEQTQNNNNALKVYKESLKIASDKGAIYLSLARVYFNLKRYKEAIKEAMKSIELNYKQGNPHLILGFY